MLSLIIDFETTGLDPVHDRIVEIGCVVTNWKILYGSLRTYINPECYFDNPVNGLNSKMLANAPTFSEILPFFYPLIHFPDEYVAHNWRFDGNFLFRELERAGLRMPKRQIFDTMKASGGKSLRVACEYYEIPTHDINWHSALGDAIATFRLVSRLRNSGSEGEGSSERVTLAPRYSAR